VDFILKGHFETSLPVGREATRQCVEALMSDPDTPVGAEVNSALLDFIIFLVILRKVLRMKDLPDPGFPSTSKKILGGSGGKGPREGSWS
jgi:hypothetical protein